MSSTYQLICMNHDPAILFGEEWQSGSGGLDAACEAARTLRPDEHGTCDVLVGRFSSPLIEVGCVVGPECTHREPQWIGVEWLRLLAAVSDTMWDQNGETLALADVQRRNRCWTDQRLGRLRTLLRRD